MMRKIDIALSLFWVALGVFFLAVMETPIHFFGILYLFMGVSKWREAI